MMEQLRYSELSMIFRGFIVGSLWAVGHIVLDIPVLLYENNLIALSYCLLISTMQLFIMRSRKRSFTASVWFVSMPCAIFMFIFLNCTSFSDLVYKIAFQKYWNQFTETYETGMVGFTLCQNISDVHQAIKTGLHFPDYYEENMDTFWDCITDFPNESFAITILGFDNLQNKFSDDTEKMLNFLEDYKCVINKRMIVKVFSGCNEYKLF